MSLTCRSCGLCSVHKKVYHVKSGRLLRWAALKQHGPGRKRRPGRNDYRNLPKLHADFARNCTYNQEYQESLSSLLQAVRRANAADMAGERGHKENFTLNVEQPGGDCGWKCRYVEISVRPACR